jgi:hypothetical protein
MRMRMRVERLNSVPCRRVSMCHNRLQFGSRVAMSLGWPKSIPKGRNPYQMVEICLETYPTGLNPSHMAEINLKGLKSVTKG